MRRLALFVSCVLLFALAGCGYRIVRQSDLAALATPGPTPTPHDLIGQRGVAMPYAQAVAGIAFRPFIPSHHLLDTALMPELKGDDTRQNRGIGFEYRSGWHRYAIMEWPQNSAPVMLTFGERYQENGCTLMVYKRGAVLWVGKRSIVTTLQDALPDPEPPPPAADGATPTPEPIRLEPAATTRDVVNEASRLVRLGAC